MKRRATNWLVGLSSTSSARGVAGGFDARSGLAFVSATATSSGAGASGIANQNVDPTPSVLSSPMSPSIRVAS